MSVFYPSIGDTVALTGPGWAQLSHPGEPSMNMIGVEATVTDLPAGIGTELVAFEVDGEPFIAPTRPGSTFQVELLPTTDREDTP